MARRKADPNGKASPRDQKAAPDYSREGSLDRYASTRSKRKRRRGLRVFLGILLACVLGMGGVALAYMNNISSKLNAGVDSALRGNLKETKGGDPFYVLLMGVDKSQSRTQGAESSLYGNSDADFRADSIILARIDPTTKQVTLVSIHRDTLIDFGSAGGKQKINAAYSIGAQTEGSSGPAYMVETISKFAGVPISHYVEIDFDGFAAVVDKLGGIEIDVPIDMDDDLAGAHLQKGLQTLNGQQALAFARSRHSYDSYGDGDVYRAANQRMVIGTIVKKILQSNPATITDTVSTMASYITTDYSVTDILNLATQFSGFDPDKNMYSGMEPTNSKYVNNTWYEICDTAAWREMMVRVNQGLSPYSDASQDPTGDNAGGSVNIKNDGAVTSGSSVTGSAGTSSAESEPRTDYSGTVEVLNGAGVTGLAGRISSTLSDSGFDTAPGTADSYDYTSTRIIYVGEENKSKANAVAEVLGLTNVQADDGTYSGEADVVVVLGSDMANN